MSQLLPPASPASFKGLLKRLEGLAKVASSLVEKHQGESRSNPEPNAKGEKPKSQDIKRQFLERVDHSLRAMEHDLTSIIRETTSSPSEQDPEHTEQHRPDHPDHPDHPDRPEKDSRS